MEEKHEYMTNSVSYTKEDLLTDIAVGSAFGEGLQLFGSFVMLLSLCERGHLKDMRDVVSWSLKDEGVHVEGLMKIFHQVKSDYPEVWNDDTKRRIYSVARHMVELEDRFISLVYTDDLNLPNLPKEDLHKYIRFLADLRLKQLGMKPVYYVPENPIKWLSKFSGEIHDDLFQNTGVSYQHSSFNTEELW
jgi:ribonucleoside-diphosphate reductase beta chain